MSAAPDIWANRALETYRDCGASSIVYESNFGGAMIPTVLRAAAAGMAIGRSVRYQGVQATSSKYLRAQNASLLYAQGRVHHLGVFPQLESEMCTFTPTSRFSPNRLDALVWALTSLDREPRLGRDYVIG